MAKEATFIVSDVIELATAVLENAYEYCENSYDSCRFCASRWMGEDTKHTYDCPVVIATAVLTGYSTHFPFQK